MNNTALIVCPLYKSLQIRISDYNHIPYSQCHMNICYICRDGLPYNAVEYNDPYHHFISDGYKYPLWSITNNNIYEYTDEYRAMDEGRKED